MFLSIGFYAKPESQSRLRPSKIHGIAQEIMIGFHSLWPTCCSLAIRDSGQRNLEVATFTPQFEQYFRIPDLYLQSGSLDFIIPDDGARSELERLRMLVYAMADSPLHHR